MFLEDWHYSRVKTKRCSLPDKVTALRTESRLPAVCLIARKQLGSIWGPNADKLGPKPSTTTQNKARRTNEIDFLRLPWAQGVRVPQRVPNLAAFGFHVEKKVRTSKGQSFGAGFKVSMWQRFKVKGLVREAKILK